MKAMRWLTGEHAVVPAIKDAGAISTLVPFLAKEKADQEAVLGSEVQLEALHALYNICNLNKKVCTPKPLLFCRLSQCNMPNAQYHLISIEFNIQFQFISMLFLVYGCLGSHMVTLIAGCCRWSH
jgi:hypothetical protein